MFIVFVGVKTYELWDEGPWELPKPSPAKASSSVEEPTQAPPRLQVATAKNIIEKNLFDPERGAGRAEQAEASGVAMQRIRSLVLLGTAILGNSRYAILQEPSEPRAPAQRTPAKPSNSLRLRVGDTVEGFKLSEIHERKVVFTKGPSRVEIALDFFRRVNEPRELPVPPPTRPGISSSVPQRPQIPAPPVAP